MEFLLENFAYFSSAYAEKSAKFGQQMAPAHSCRAYAKKVSALSDYDIKSANFVRAFPFRGKMTSDDLVSQIKSA